MIHISVRENKHGTWWCNGTIQGYDHSFEGGFGECQMLMAELLNKKGIREKEVIWNAPQYYKHLPENNSKLPIGYASWRLDKGMV